MSCPYKKRREIPRFARNDTPGGRACRSVRRDEMDEGAEGDAGGTFGHPSFLVVVPGGAGDVQMDPRCVAGELFDEHGAGDGAAAFSTADILNIREAALDEFAVVVVDGHLPHFFAGGFGAGE